MDAAAAALIGAGVASVVSLSSQFLAHELALRQDRRNARRQRLTNAIEEAGAALHGPVRDERMTDEEFEQWKAALKPDSLAARNPELTRDLMPFNEGIYRAMVTLELQFGQGHWLGERFIDAATACASAEEAKSLHFTSANEDWRIKNIPALAEKAKEARDAREEWMRLARQEVDRV
ncbi:MAG TPA: hypothetical protein VFY69_05815 [Solirubrobacterales bacterium]|nr:hypothetical protein [Solirubrobacterales bacterium]